MPNCFVNTASIYMPAIRVISGITNDKIPTVTTTTAHNYLDGEIVRFYIPLGYGMREINRKLAIVKVVSDDQFTIDLDTSDFDEFTALKTFPYDAQCAQVVPVGEISSTFKGATKNVLPSGVR